MSDVLPLRLSSLSMQTPWPYRRDEWNRTHKLSTGKGSTGLPGWSTKPWLGIKDFSIAMLAVTRCDSLHVVWWMSWMLTHWGLVQLFSNSQRKEKRSQIDWSTSLAEKLCTVFKGFLASVKNYFTTCLMCFSITRYCLCCLMVSKFNATLVWNTEQGFAWSQHVWF